MSDLTAIYTCDWSRLSPAETVISSTWQLRNDLTFLGSYIAKDGLSASVILTDGTVGTVAVLSNNIVTSRNNRYRQDVLYPVGVTGD